MKNIHIIPTDKPSRLFISDTDKVLELDTECIISEDYWIKNQNIYITSDEEIKEGDWVYSETRNKVCKVTRVSKWSHKNDYSIDLDNENYYIHNSYGKKIILTTDQDLIKDGVQAIDDEFLEWFVKNPSCEEVDVVFNNRGITGTEKILKTFGEYKIIIPKEEPKQETLEEAFEFWSDRQSSYDKLDILRFGAVWQQEQILDFLYSEITERRDYSASKMCEKVIEFIEQFKNK
jgi:hypothetical protein